MYCFISQHGVRWKEVIKILGKEMNKRRKFEKKKKKEKIAKKKKIRDMISQHQKYYILKSCQITSFLRFTGDTSSKFPYFVPFVAGPLDFRFVLICCFQKRQQMHRDAFGEKGRKFEFQIQKKIIKNKNKRHYSKKRRKPFSNRLRARPQSGR